MSWQNKLPPVRRWIVPGWLAPGTVALLHGEGGTGKSLVAQGLMTSIATGRPWMGREVDRGPVVGIFAEDDADELHRRQAAINARLGVDMIDLVDMTLAATIGEDNRLVELEGNALRATERLDQILVLARRLRPKLVVLDTLSDVYGEDENSRPLVSQFLKAHLGRIAHETDAAILLTAHPSRAGIGSGRLDGGSTAWRAGARACWSLAGASSNPSGEDRDARVLRLEKTNHAARGEEIAIRWIDGAFAADVDGPSTLDRIARSEKARAVFLVLLDRFRAADRSVSDKARAGTFAPKVFADEHEAAGLASKDLERAMRDLFADGTIRLEQYGSPSAGTFRLARVAV